MYSIKYGIVQNLTNFALTNHVRGLPFVCTATFFRRVTALIFVIVPGIFATKSLCSAKCVTSSICPFS